MSEGELNQLSALDAFDSDEWMHRTARAATTVELGTLAGYAICRVVQRGGQGTVYEATEPRSGRRVALKRLPYADFGTLETERFTREVEALGALNHPNIVTLLAAPEADDARIIVMEWIDGLPLDAWADEEWLNRSPAAAATSIARCHAKISAAVSAAHARGIMHRDLKPSNVLVTADGEPKVLDFGLAKHLDAPQAATRDRTRTNGFAGTPMWSSPEQVAGAAHEVDARTDVHGLGLLLYRALAGRTPFDSSLAIAPLFEAIRTHTPIAPSRVRRGIPRELDLITMRALEKEPARRYPSAESFGRELQRHLNGEPIEAHPASSAYIVRRLIGRHRLASVAAAVALSAVLTGSVVTALYAVDAERSRVSAVARATEADAARTRAERMNGFFQDLLANLRERDAVGEQSSARQIIAVAVQALERSDTPKDAEGDLRTTLGVALHELGDYENAILQLSRAVDILSAAAPTPTNDRELARVLGLLMTAHARADNPLAVIEVGYRCIEQYEAINASLDLISGPYERIALALGGLGRVGEAREAVDRARALSVQSGNPLAIANALSSDALILQFEGKNAEAAEVAIEAASCASDIANGTPDALKPIELARFLHNAAFLLTESGRAADALPYAQESLELRERHYGLRHPALLTARAQLAYALRNLNRHDEGIAILESSLELFEAPTDKPIVARGNLLRHLGRAYEIRNAQGDRERCLDTVRAAIINIAGAGSGYSDRCLSCMNTLTRCTIAGDGMDAAEALLTQFAEYVGQQAHAPSVASFMRTAIVNMLIESRMKPAFVASAEQVALARRDLALVSNVRGADSIEALTVELMLARLLRSSVQRESLPLSVLEASTRGQSVLDRARERYGASSVMARTAEAFVNAK